MKQEFQEEQNIKIHFIIMVFVIIGGFICKINQYEWMICILSFGMVISLELVNTAIENTVDLAMPDQHPKAKVAKDIAAGAVFVGSVTAFIIGLIIFIPKIIPN